MYIEVNTFKQMWSLLPVGERMMILLIIPSSFVRIRSSVFGDSSNPGYEVELILHDVQECLLITFLVCR